MPATIQQSSSTATVITALTPPHDNKAKLAKHGMQQAQVSATPDEPNNLAQVSMARLLASCGDCV